MCIRDRVDTYNIEEAVKTAVEVAGPELGGVRIDSGDLASLAPVSYTHLDVYKRQPLTGTGLPGPSQATVSPGSPISRLMR